MPKHLRKCHGDPCPKISIGSGDERIALHEACETSPVILIFYSGDFSPQAITLLKRFANEYEKYIQAGFALIAIGSGNDSTREAFIKKFAIPFPCLHDSKKSAAKAFKVTKKIGNKLLIEPHVFVINTDKIICFEKRGYPKRADILKLCK